MTTRRELVEIGIWFSDALSRALPWELPAEATDRLQVLIAEEQKLARIAEPATQLQRRWTKEDDRRLVDMQSQHMTAPMIARRLGRSPWSVRSRTRTLKRKARNA